MAHDDDLTEEQILELIEMAYDLGAAPELAASPVFPASFSAPCARCARPRLSAVEPLCVDCACEASP